MLVLLPPTFCRDMLGGCGLGVSGGEKDLSSSSSTGGDSGVFGRGFSRMRSLGLRSCLAGRRGNSSGAVASTSVVAAPRSPTWRLDGLLWAPEMEPSFRMPLLTPEKKSPRSDGPSSSVADLDSTEAGGGWRVVKACKPGPQYGQSSVRALSRVETLLRRGKGGGLEGIARLLTVI